MAEQSPDQQYAEVTRKFTVWSSINLSATQAQIDRAMNQFANQYPNVQVQDAGPVYTQSSDTNSMFVKVSTPDQDATLPLSTRIHNIYDNVVETFEQTDIPGVGEATNAQPTFNKPITNHEAVVLSGQNVYEGASNLLDDDPSDNANFDDLFFDEAGLFDPFTDDDAQFDYVADDGGDPSELFGSKVRASIQNTQINTINPQDNVLDQYASYTYSISLYVLEKTAYNKIVVGSTADAASAGFIDKVLADSRSLLIQSGGINNSSRHPLFGEDFYIDELSMNHIPPTTTRARNSNITSVSFKIFEPYGITLLDRLFNTAKDLLGASNGQQYIHLPYLLQVKFYGYDDNGAPLGEIPQTTRRVIIKINNIDFEFAGGTGITEYQIEGVAYSNLVYEAPTVTIKHAVEVEAEKVKDIFEHEATTTNPASGGFDVYIPESKTVETLGLAAVLNNQEKYVTSTDTIQDSLLVSDFQNKGNKYEFNLSPEIGDARIVYPEKSDAFDINGLPMNTAAQQQYQNLTKKVKVNTKKKLFRINAGTSIVELLNLVIPFSSFIDGEFNQDGNTRPLRWYRIIPTVLIQDWDSQSQQFTHLIRYNVISSRVFGIVFPGLPSTTPTSSGVHKIYDYSFTGNNKSIVDLNIKFNAAYYHHVTTNADSSISITPTEQGNNPYAVRHRSSGAPAGADAVVPLTAGNDLLNNVLSDGVDLLTVDMSILGDPAYILQNSVFYQGHTHSIPPQIFETPFLPDGSINGDFSDAYFQLNFKTPVDYDPTTGLSDGTKRSNFSGRYRISNIVSNFSDGVFSQELSGLRLEDQGDGNSITQTNRDGTQTVRQIRFEDDAEAVRDFLGQKTDLFGEDSIATDAERERREQQARTDERGDAGLLI